MIKSLLTKKGITGLLKKTRIGGETVNAILRLTRANTKRALKALWRLAVNADMDVGDFINQLDRVISGRKRDVLRTIRNILVGVRGEARNAIRTERRGAWHNVGTLDGDTTDICIEHMGLSWRAPEFSYATIPNKPPRMPPIHPCRSFLRWVPEGQQFVEEPKFIEQFNADEDLQRDLLGKRKFAAMKRGEFTIRSIADFEKYARRTLSELGL